MDKTVKRFYDLANNYHVAAFTLWVQIVDAPYIYNPTIYLLRHTAELLLKGLIIKETLHINPKFDFNELVIEDGSKKVKLNLCHSLSCLWDNYQSLHTKNRLIPCYDKSQKSLINKTFRFIDNIDYNSTTFRYPYTKKGKSIVIEPLNLDISGKSIEIGKTPPTIMQFGKTVCVIKKGNRYIQNATLLFETVELLFGFYGM